MAIQFYADKDFETALYKGITIVDTDNKTYGVADLNGDPVAYLDIDYIKGSEDGIKLTFQIGKYPEGPMREVRVVKREYDANDNAYKDTLILLELEITESINTFYFIPLPITNDQLRIDVDTINGDEPNDLRINVKSQSYRS